MDQSEEFNNFMHKVNDISNIIKNMQSDDKNIQNMAIDQAKKYLENNESKDYIQNTNINDIKTKVKFNKSVINEVVIEENPGTMSQASFMKSVEKDAANRYENRMRRSERSNTLKKRANNAFRAQQYEKSVQLYTEAISYTKDSCVLYTNRALTYINLKLYSKAIEDSKMALKLNENSLKAWLYLAKCYYLENNESEYKNAINESMNRNPSQIEFIRDFVEKMTLANNDTV